MNTFTLLEVSGAEELDFIYFFQLAPIHKKIKRLPPNCCFGYNRDSSLYTNQEEEEESNWFLLELYPENLVQ